MDRLEQLSVEMPQGPRSALLRLPETPVPAAPVVLLLHGAGGTARLALGNTRWPALADREGFALVAPEGLRRDPASPPMFRQNPQTWNDGSGRGHTARAGTDDVGFLVAVLDLALSRCGGDPGRVYACGFSNGGSMAFRFAAERPGRVAAIGPVAGHCWIEPDAAGAPVPACMIFGALDPLNPPAGADVTTPWGTQEYHPPIRQSLDRWRAFNRCRGPVVEAHPAEGVHEWRAEACAPGGETTLVLVEDLGHHWPGGDRLLPVSVAGPASRRLDGAATLWDFFRRHRRAEARGPGAV